MKKEKKKKKKKKQKRNPNQNKQQKSSWNARMQKAFSSHWIALIFMLFFKHQKWTALLNQLEREGGKSRFCEPDACSVFPVLAFFPSLSTGTGDGAEQQLNPPESTRSWAASPDSQRRPELGH